MDVSQPSAFHVRIDLSRRDICMPQHGLNGSQIGPTFQQMRGKRMPQHVRGDRLGNTGAARPLQKQLPKCLPRESSSSPTDEQNAGRSPFE